MKSLKGLNGKRKKVEVKDLDLAPMLSLMIAIIPVLLATSVILKIRIFDSSVFPASDKVMQSDGANESPIAYLEIANTNMIKVEVKRNERLVFKTTSSLNGLHQTLKQVKARFPDMKSLKIESASDVSYKEIIRVFDMAKTPIENEKNETSKETLFEDVTLEDIFKG